MNMTSVGVISSLGGELEGMSRNERRIAQEILNSPAEITSISSQALAQRCDVSQSSIIKFCQKIGLSGFPALKIALSAEVARNEKAQQIHGDIFSDDSLGAVAKKVFDSKVSALSETMKLNSNDELEAAVSLLERANRVIILGVGGSALIANDLSIKLTKFGKAVVHGGDSHIQLANLASLTRDDLLVAISYSGKTKEVIVAVEYAQAQAIPVVFLGGFKVDQRVSASDVVLRCTASENLVRSSSIATRTAQLAITDLLFVLLVQRQGEVAHRIHESQSLVGKIR
jgi:RpiR family transcriptional regulator, murPQ operon repressor